MKLIEFNWRPSDRQLRQFGLICLIALPAVGWLWGGGTTTIVILGVIGAVIACLGLAAPQAVKPVFIALSLVATPIGMVLGELAMMLIYFGVFLPMALVFRLMGRDALELRLDRNRESYWQPKKPPKDVESYYRQS